MKQMRLLLTILFVIISVAGFMPLCSNAFSFDKANNVVTRSRRSHLNLQQQQLNPRRSILFEKSNRNSASSGKIMYLRRYNNNNSSQLQLSMTSSTIMTMMINPIRSIINTIFVELRNLSVKQGVLMMCTFLIGFGLGKLRPFWKRYTSMVDIPSSYFVNNGSSTNNNNKGIVLKGRAVSISDGDTIRFLHQPTRFHPSTIRNGKNGNLNGNGKNKKKEKLSEVALPIRLSTIDTPETAKFGKPGQPYGIEAKEYLTNLLHNKVVQIRLLRMDQYGRGVAEVFTTTSGLPIPFWPFQSKKYMDQELLIAGLAEVYQGGGAVYGPLGKERYLELEQEARKKKIGIWSNKKRESAAEYKRRTKG